MSNTLDRRVRTMSAIITALVGLAGLTLSFESLRAVALQAGIDPHLAFLLPACLDGLTIVSSMQVVHAATTRTSATVPWLVVGGAVVTSVVFNASLASSVQDKAVHMIPVLSGALCLEMLVASLKRRVIETHAEAERIAQEAAAEATRIAREEAAHQRAERRARQPAKSRQTASRAPSRSRSTGRHDPNTVAKVKRMRASGASYREIEEATGVSKSRVGALLAQHSETQPAARHESEGSAA